MDDWKSNLHKRFFEQYDLYSLGLTIWFICHGFHPATNLIKAKTREAEERGNIVVNSELKEDFLRNESIPSLPRIYSSNLREIISLLTKPIKHNTPDKSFDSLAKNPVIVQYSDSESRNRQRNARSKCGDSMDFPLFDVVTFINEVMHIESLKVIDTSRSQGKSKKFNSAPCPSKTSNSIP